jgi:hypothetical protein
MATAAIREKNLIERQYAAGTRRGSMSVLPQVDSAVIRSCTPFRQSRSGLDGRTTGFLRTFGVPST